MKDFRVLASCFLLVFCIPDISVVLTLFLVLLLASSFLLSPCSFWNLLLLASLVLLEFLLSAFLPVAIASSYSLGQFGCGHPC
jgi:hypothetical protein